MPDDEFETAYPNDQDDGHEHWWGTPAYEGRHMYRETCWCRQCGVVNNTPEHVAACREVGVHEPAGSFVNGTQM